MFVYIFFIFKTNSYLPTSEHGPASAATAAFKYTWSRVGLPLTPKKTPTKVATDASSSAKSDTNIGFLTISAAQDQ